MDHETTLDALNKLAPGWTADHSQSFTLARKDFAFNLYLGTRNRWGWEFRYGRGLMTSHRGAGHPDPVAAATEALAEARQIATDLLAVTGPADDKEPRP